MVVIEFPKSNVDDVEILITKEIWVEVDIIFGLDIEERLEDIGSFELTEAHLVIVLAIGHVEHAMDHTEGVPLLELRSILEEVKAGVQFQDLLEQHLKIINSGMLLLRL